VYPALLVTMVLVMLVFLVTYVVPEFAKLFENLNAQLPTITVIMLAIGTRGAEVCSVRSHCGCGRGGAVLALEEYGQRSRAHRCGDPEVAPDG
jgi:type II secretory pathway component PulF